MSNKPKNSVDQMNRGLAPVEILRGADASERVRHLHHASFQRLEYNVPISYDPVSSRDNQIKRKLLCGLRTGPSSGNDGRDIGTASGIDGRGGPGGRSGPPDAPSSGKSREKRSLRPPPCDEGRFEAFDGRQEAACVPPGVSTPDI